jgi:hypothetical protein
MWQQDQNGQWEYTGGQDDWLGAQQQAQRCTQFRLDDESEWVADTPRSCYNCRYRRWTATAFVCLVSGPTAPPD